MYWLSIVCLGTEWWTKKGAAFKDLTFYKSQKHKNQTKPNETKNNNKMPQNPNVQKPKHNNPKTFAKLASTVQEYMMYNKWCFVGHLLIATENIREF